MAVRALGLSLYGPQAASTRHRLCLYEPGLRELGVELKTYALLGDDYVRASFAGERYPTRKHVANYVARLRLLLTQSRYDVAIIQGELFPLVPGAIETKLLKIPFIYDFDDAFFMKYRHERFRWASPFLRSKFEHVVAKAAAVTAGSKYLYEFADQHSSEARLLPTVVDTTTYVSAPKKRRGAFTIGWIGSPSTSTYLSQVIEPLQRLGREAPLRFLVVGAEGPPIAGVEVISVPWTQASEVDVINSFDVGIMPLADDPWARGKCAFKLIQYLACGVPAVASPVGANIEVITGGCGLLAETAGDWVQSLRRLRDDPVFGAEIGRLGRQKIEREYSLQAMTPRFAEVIRRAARPPGHTPQQF